VPTKNPDFDRLLRIYKVSIERWVAAIHAEESLATADHSMFAMESWDSADFAVQTEEKRAKKARDDYKTRSAKRIMASSESLADY